MTWDGEERRVGDASMQTDIALIKQDVKHVREVVEKQSGSIETIATQVRCNSEHRIRMNGIKEEFKGHVVQDRWLFGLIITLIVGLFIKIVL